jgi:hypothetical protein
MKKVFVILLTVLIVFTHSIAFARNEDALKIASDTASVDIIVDILITRPIGFVGLVGGTAIFVLTLPIAAVTKSLDRTTQAFVKEPYEYTFVRPLGDIRGEKNY